MNDIINMLKEVNWETITIFGISLTALIPLFTVLVKSFATKLFNKLSPDSKATIKKIEDVMKELATLKEDLSKALKTEVLAIKDDLKEIISKELNLEDEILTIISNNKILKTKQNKKEIAKQVVVEQTIEEQPQEVKEEVLEETKEVIVEKENNKTKKKKKTKNNVSYI